MKILIILTLACALHFKALTAYGPNGMKCFTCLGGDCSHTMECMGMNECCMTTSVTIKGNTVKAKGCSPAFDMKEPIGPVSAFEIKPEICCGRSLCNSALRIGQNILFLSLLPLTSFILFG